MIDSRQPAPINVSVPVTIDPGAVQVDARTTVEGARVEVRPTEVTIEKGAVQIDAPAPVVNIEPTVVNVAPAAVTIEKGAVQVQTTSAPLRKVKKSIVRDKNGRLSGTVEEEIE